MQNYDKNNELYHYGVKGQKWGVRRSKLGITGSQPKARVFGRVIDERQKKSERQKRYEDDHGINPHRPNGTRNGKRISEMKLGKLDNYRVVKHGKVLVEKLLDPDLTRK